MAVWSASFDAIGVRNTVAVDQEDELETALRISRDEVDALDRACSRFRDDSELAAVNRAAGAEVPVGASSWRSSRPRCASRRQRGDWSTPRSAPRFAHWATTATSACSPAPILVLCGSSPQRAGAGCASTVAASRSASRGEADSTSVPSRRPSPPTVSGGSFARRPEPTSSSASAAMWPWRARPTVAGPWGSRTTTADRRPGRRSRSPTGGSRRRATTVRRWLAGGRAHHHIVDPATGSSAEEHWRTVTVAAATCVDANAAATAAIVIGAPAVDWLESLGLAARLVRTDGSVTATSRWPVQGR